jgi:hypothetical protein
VKNQYFGDKNDFFKFDLALTLIEKRKLKHFTYIPMLTHDDESGQGGQTNYDGRERPDLADFLRSRVEASDRNVKSLRSFMSRKKFKHIGYKPYRDDNPFPSGTKHEEKEWGKYFDRIPQSWLNRSLTLILIDPDTGLDPDPEGRKYNDKYLTYNYLNYIYTHMKSSSLLLVYQHIGPFRRDTYFRGKGRGIRRAIGNAGPVCVSNNVVAFFVMARDHKLLHEAWNIIKDYSKEHHRNRGKRTLYRTYKCGSDLRSA